MYIYIYWSTMIIVIQYWVLDILCSNIIINVHLPSPISRPTPLPATITGNCFVGTMVYSKVTELISCRTLYRLLTSHDPKWFPYHSNIVFSTLVNSPHTCIHNFTACIPVWCFLWTPVRMFSIACGYLFSNYDS